MKLWCYFTAGYWWPLQMMQRWEIWSRCIHLVAYKFKWCVFLLNFIVELLQLKCVLCPCFAIKWFDNKSPHWIKLHILPKRVTIHVRSNQSVLCQMASCRLLKLWFKLQLHYACHWIISKWWLSLMILAVIPPRLS